LKIKDLKVIMLIRFVSNEHYINFNRTILSQYDTAT